MNTPIDISNVVLKTERLTLRPWRQSDLQDFFEYASVDGVGQMAGWIPHASLEESQMILDRFVNGKKTFALEYQGKVIGSLGVELYKEENFPELADKQCREIGYVLSKDYWGRGLMAEAVKEVIRYLFEEVKLDIILCAHFLRNHQSARVQEKCGFRHYAYGTYETRYGTVEDDETNIITREDWEKEMKKKGEDIMRIAVTYENGQVFQHFGHTREFKLYDVKEGKVVFKQIVESDCPGHGYLAGFLKEVQADLLICGGIGMGARNALAEAGIELFAGVSGDADAAVRAYLNGELQGDSEGFCDHHGHEHGHDCHHEDGECHHGSDHRCDHDDEGCHCH